ncbi:MAG: hypothetical protein EP329_06600, partial [Deltaproteobacteria bacterium]
MDELLAQHLPLARLLLKRAWARREHLELDDDLDVAIEALAEAPAPPALAELSTRWGLTPVERDTWATLAALAHAPELGLQAGELQATFGSATLTVWLAGWLLEPLHGPAEVTRALATSGRLAGCGLVEVLDPAKPFQERRVVVPPAVLWELDGGWADLPEELASCAWELGAPEPSLAPVDETVTAAAAAALGDPTRPVTLVVEGDAGVGRKSL